MSSNPPVDYLSFSMTATDLAYVITQQQLNNALAAFIESEKAPIAFAYDLDANGNPITPADPKNPQVSFNATITLGKDDSGHLLPIVDMSNPGANNSVQFTLGFTGGTFVDQTVGISYAQSSSEFAGETWAVTFDVPFKQLDQIDPTAAPAAAAQVLSNLNSTFDNVFSLSQILIDLSSVVAPDSTSTGHPANFNRFAWIDFVSCLTSALQSQAETIFTNPLAAGYAVIQSGTAETPTFTPTDVEITVLGNASNPAASLLVFGMATQGELSGQWQEDFAGTELVTDPSVTPGLIFVRADLFSGFLQQQLANSSYAQSVASYVEVSGTNTAFGYSNASAQPSFTPKNPPELAESNLNDGSPQTSTQNIFLGVGSASQTAATTSKSTAMYWPSDNLLIQSVQILGYVQLFIAYQETAGSRTGSITVHWASPTFTYGWNANFVLTVFNDTGSGSQGIGFSMGSSSFPTIPTHTDPSTAENWDTVASIDQLMAVSAPKPIVQDLQSMSQTIPSLLTNVQLLVFPGAGNFTFQNPVVNSAFTLVATIQYVNPG